MLTTGRTLLGASELMKIDDQPNVWHR